MSETREFDLGDILTIIDGRLISPRHMAGVYDILNFMTGEDVFTHQIPRLMREAKPILLRAHPQLDSPEINFAFGELTLMLETPTGKNEPVNLVAGWLSKLKATFGETLPVPKMDAFEHERIDPLSELVEHVHPDRIIIASK